VPENKLSLSASRFLIRRASLTKRHLKLTVKLPKTLRLHRGALCIAQSMKWARAKVQKFLQINRKILAVNLYLTPIQVLFTL